MKTMILAAAAALSLSAGAAFANDGGYGGTTQFTSIPGVVAYATAAKPASAVAQNGQVRIYATQASQQSASPFQPGYNNG